MEKITVKLSGKDGNVFNLVAIAGKALIKNGQEKESREMVRKVLKSKNYDAALAVIGEYCKVE